MIQKLGCPTLKQRRDNTHIIMLYKIIHNIVHINYSDVLIENTNPTRGHSQRFYVPRTKINAYHYSLFPSMIMIMIYFGYKKTKSYKPNLITSY